ncbi:hypothetical protein OUZ56_028821 [Daphnia magna]|uniref:Uncharacterized protein n=1 Tax=Daphnia magna TaxID=35525 RepID=A0ABR0B5K1_9CRUS|nr:hypothetical protein OUZ56_028821 [Daphnia magna]
MTSLEGEEATHKSELTVNRSRKNLSETFHPLPASLSHAPDCNSCSVYFTQKNVLLGLEIRYHFMYVFMEIELQFHDSSTSEWDSNPSLQHIKGGLPGRYRISLTTPRSVVRFPGGAWCPGLPTFPGVYLPRRQSGRETSPLRSNGTDILAMFNIISDNKF